MTTLDGAFRATVRDHLLDTHVPRLERAVALLPEGDLWWRPHDEVVSVGTILLHLEGNVRQWILSGLGGAPDGRVREAEFTARDGPPAAELLARLRDTVTRACDVVDGLDADDLTAERTIQGFAVTPVAALVHVVEHFAWHTGQAVWIAKARAGADHGLSFYDQARVNAARNG